MGTQHKGIRRKKEKDMGRAVLLCAAILIVLPQLASAVCEVSVDKSTNMAPNSLGTFNHLSSATAVAASPYCQFSDVGDGTLKMTLVDGEDCMPLCTVGYMANAFYECGTGSIVVTPVCLPATKITNKLSYNGQSRRAGDDIVGADTAANYNANTAAGMLVRSFFECGMLQMLMDPDGTIDTTELAKVGTGAGQCIFGTVSGTAVPYTSASSVLTADTDATAANKVPWAYITSSAAAGAANTIDITFTTYVLSTASVAQANSAATTITQAHLKANADAVTAAFASTVYTAVLACGQKTGATQAADCPDTGADASGAFNDAVFATNIATATEAADFAYAAADSNVRYFCPRSLFTSTFSGTMLQVNHADNANTCLYGVPVGGGCAPKCNSNFMASEKFMCTASSTSGAAATLDLDYMPTCLATNEVTFTVAYVDGDAGAFPANTGSIAAYNAQTGGASSGYAARALFGCAAMELALGGTAAKAGDSDGQCIVQTVGHKTATTANYKNGGVSITSTSVKLLNTNSDNSMPWATISSVASAQVTNGFTITFTMKFVPNALAAATVKTEAEIATAVNAITAANFNTALASVVANGDGMVNAVGLLWPCFGSATTYGCAVLADATADANNGVYDANPATTAVQAADFTFTDPVLASQSAICYPAATPGVGNLPTSVTNGALNSCAQALPFGASCTYNCSSGYTANAVTTFECSASGTASYVAPNVGNMTCTAPAAAAASNTSCTYGATSTCATRISQSIVISSLAVADYIGNLKATYECSYAKMVSATWCTATTGAVTYLSGVQVTSTAAARRAARRTFVMDVETSVMTAAAVQTAVQSGVTAANLVTQMTAINTATGWSVTVPAAADITVNTATFSGAATSSAAVAIPSAIMVLLGSLISLFWN